MSTQVEIENEALPESPKSKTKRNRKNVEPTEVPEVAPSEVSLSAATPPLNEEWEWEFTDRRKGPDESEEEFIVISPKDVIIPPYDARASDGVLTDTFKKSIHDQGIDTAIMVTPVRHKTHPEKTGYALVVGRRRVRAAKEAGNARNKYIPARVQRIKDLADYLTVAGRENTQREGMNTWDYITYCQKLVKLGLSQSQVAERTHFSNAHVSKLLQVLELDTRIQRYVRAGKLDTTKTREISRLKTLDGEMLNDEQVDLANKAVERGWSAVDIREHIDRKKAQMLKKAKEERSLARVRKSAAASTEEGEKPTPEAPKSKFDRATIAQPKKVIAHKMAEWAWDRLVTLRAKENVDPLKVKYQEGILEGMRYQLGLKEPPRFLVDSEE